MEWLRCSTAAAPVSGDLRLHPLDDVPADRDHPAHGAAVVLVLLPVAFLVDAVAALALLAAVVAGVNVVEYRIVVRRTAAAAGSAA